MNQRARHAATLLCLPPLLAGCAIGPVRQHRMDALGPYAGVTTAKVEVEGEAPDPVKRDLASGLSATLAERSGLRPADAADRDSFVVRLKILEAGVPPAVAQAEGTGEGGGERGGGPSVLDNSNGRLAFSASLVPPGGPEAAGFVRWETRGDATALAKQAGRDAGEVLGRDVVRRRDEFVTRRAADERLFLVPTALTLERGEVEFSDDELLLLRFGVGVSRRVQLDMTLGGLPVPGAGAVPFGLGVAGVAGTMLFGVFDLGCKVRLLDEGARLPGLALSYDLLDLFGGGLGGGGAIMAKGAGVAGVAGTVNLQFNLFALTAAKHFGSTQFVAGSYLLDNHHFLPQSAHLFAAGSGVGDNGSGVAAGESSQELDRLPLQWQAYLAVQQVLGPHSELTLELLPRSPASDTVMTTGARWLLGASEPHGPLAADRIRVKIDAALLWKWLPADAADERKQGGPGCLPWLGFGLYFL